MDGVANFFLAPTSDPGAGKPLTHHTGRGIQARDVSGVVMYRWSLDSRYVIYPQDQNGDENWNLYRIDVATGEERDLTGLEHATVELEELSSRDPRRALISVREKMVALPQLYTLDLETGEKSLVAANSEFLAFTADHDLRPRTAVKLNAEGGLDILRAAGEGKWEPLFTVGTDDTAALSATGYQKIGRFDRDNRRSYFYDSRGRDTIALVDYDFETGKLEMHRLRPARRHRRRALPPHRAPPAGLRHQLDQQHLERARSGDRARPRSSSPARPKASTPSSAAATTTRSGSSSSRWRTSPRPTSSTGGPSAR